MNENLEPVKHEVNNVENENNLQEQHATVATEPQELETKLTTKEEIITKLQELNNLNEAPTRIETEGLKQAFYKIKSAEIAVLKNQFVADGGVAEDFVSSSDSQEEELKSLLNQIKEKRAKAQEQEEAEKEKNLETKLQIIDTLKGLTENTDQDFNVLYKEFKDLQQKWNDIKLVPAAKVNELWKSYQMYSEKFYDLIKINNEFRDYDFKKNLELKTAICESVEKLIDEEDVVSAFHQLQNFHQQWREIGPVSKEHREELWDRFKAASTEINKRHQSHFEHLKSLEETNLVEKTAICETLKTIDFSALQSFKDWDEKSKEVIDLQAKWKTIGFVPRKFNNQIFEQYRALCDKFFEKKAEFFKTLKDEMEINLNKKKALLEKAQSLKDSTDWKKTTDEMIAIQKEWKTIGTIPRKFSDSIWKEFVAACDYFFEQKNKNVSSVKDEEVANLAKKKEVIEKINNLASVTDSKEAMDNLRQYMDEWHAIGFVPFKEKDKIYKEYQSALDVQFDRLKLDKSERRMQSFKSNIDDIVKADRPKGRLFKERDRLVHQFNKVKSDLQTYENNMGFLSISKNAGGLLKEMEHKIQDLKNELDLIAQKIETIDNNIKELD